MIIFDTSFLVVLLHPNPPPAKDREDRPVSQFRERVANLVSRMDISNDPVGVPAPAMAEVLVGAGKGRHQYVSILSNTYRFQILPFDSRAAIEASELIALIKTNKQPWGTWAKVKFDIQIVSIAKADSASLIYADDIHIENLAKRLKIPVMRICDLPAPVIAPEEETVIGTSIDGTQRLLNLEPPKDEAKLGEATIGQAQEDDKLKADSAHSPAIPRGVSGHTETEPTGEVVRESEGEDLP